MTLLTEDEITARLAGLPGWEQHRRLHRRRPYRGPTSATRCSTGGGRLSGRGRHHHPDIAIQWDKVTLTLSTHSAGGLTGADFELAEQISAPGLTVAERNSACGRRHAPGWRRPQDEDPPTACRDPRTPCAARPQPGGTQPGDPAGIERPPDEGPPPRLTVPPYPAALFPGPGAGPRSAAGSLVIHVVQQRSQQLRDCVGAYCAVPRARLSAERECPGCGCAGPVARSAPGHGSWPAQPKSQGRCLMPLMKLDSSRSGSAAARICGTRLHQLADHRGDLAPRQVRAQAEVRARPAERRRADWGSG